MSDGNKGAISQTFEDLGEALVKPAVDEVGKALEVGVQSVTGATPNTSANIVDPVARQKKEMEEQEGKQKALWTIRRQEEIEQNLKQVRAGKQQQETQKQQKDQEEAQVKQYKLMDAQKKQQSIAVTIAQTGAENKNRGAG